MLLDRSEHLHAQSRLFLIQTRLQEHLRPRQRAARTQVRDPGVADRLRALLDANVQQGLCLEDAARQYLLDGVPPGTAATLAGSTTSPT